MNRPPDAQSPEPTPDAIEAAVEALQRGSPDAFERLLDPLADGSARICRLFATLTSPPPPSQAPGPHALVDERKASIPDDLTPET